MSSVPAGKRSWKCPECGTEVLLPVTQLDPIACDACLARMKKDREGGITQTITSVAAGPLGLWLGLSELTKFGLVLAALLVGLLIGYVAGKMSAKPAPAAPHSTRTIESATTNSAPPVADSGSDEVLEERPDPPGPGYKWMPGRKHKDGTHGKGYWAKDPHYKGDENSTK